MRSDQIASGYRNRASNMLMILTSPTTSSSILHVNLQLLHPYVDTIKFQSQCKFCKREGTITMIPGRGSPLTFEFSERGKHAPLMVFDYRGFEPLDFAFSSGWKAESIEGTKFEDIDLSGWDFSEYYEKGECPVMISNVTAMFKVVDLSHAKAMFVDFRLAKERGGGCYLR
ncbi:hypothetical protein L2E82_40799 [Cichorium intybus]|uniref:Uncharacterized protein n=1 Tax=Cichorium intybus TaxID=13427 RepID=A0ACB9AMD3_CICIN|nr:hypothetical protein L2E82_40799 [Cichorium intybus]